MFQKMTLWEFPFELDGTRNINYWEKSRFLMTDKELSQVVTVAYSGKDKIQLPTYQHLK